MRALRETLCERRVSEQPDDRASETFGITAVDKQYSLIRKGKVKVFRGNLGSQSNTKRAIVTLEEGHRIDVTTGL